MLMWVGIRTHTRLLESSFHVHCHLFLYYIIMHLPIHARMQLLTHACIYLLLCFVTYPCTHALTHVPPTPTHPSPPHRTKFAEKLRHASVWPRGPSTMSAQGSQEGSVCLNTFSGVPHGWVGSSGSRFF